MAPHSMLSWIFKTRRGLGLIVPLVLGAISTASWLYASFIGASRLIAPLLSFADFVALYWWSTR